MVSLCLAYHADCELTIEVRRKAGDVERTDVSLMFSLGGESNFSIGRPQTTQTHRMQSQRPIHSTDKVMPRIKDIALLDSSRRIEVS